MTIDHGSVAVGTTATSIAGPYGSAAEVTIHNGDGSKDVFIGDAGVLTSDGAEVPSGESRTLTLPAGDELYGVTTATTATTTYIATHG